MNYLYGDSSPSQLTSNFLEFLRDAIDFSVAVLKADERIQAGQARARDLNAEAEAETQRLDGFIQIVSEAIESADKGLPASPTSRTGTRLMEQVADTHRGAVKGIRQRLADELALIDTDEADAREACVKALEALILPHDPPDSSSVLTITLADSGSYAATLSAHAAFGLEWTIDLAIPERSLWAAPVHVNRVIANLQIHAPQLSGWISKEVKVKSQKLERHIVTELVDDGRTVRLKLRQEPAAPSGYDLAVDPDANVVQATRVGPAEDASVGAFSPADEDVAPLVELASKLRPGATDLPRRALRAASSAGTDFRVQPAFGDFVQRLVAMMAPIVHELSQRSLTRDELIMRRPLSDDRREEIFMSKATLTAKYDVLSAPLRALFAPLRLDHANAASPPPPIAPPASAQDAPIRAELPASSTPPAAPSRPPPAAPPPRPVPQSTPPGPQARAEQPRSQPPPPPVRSASPQTAQRGAVAAGTPWGARAKGGPTPLGPLPPARTPPRKKEPASPPPASRPPPAATTEQASIEVTAIEDILLSDLPAEGGTENAPDELPASTTAVQAGGQTRNEELVATLKKIVSAIRGGRIEEAYRDYAALFSDDNFGLFRPEEQRQALRLMVIPKIKPAASDPVLDAHRAALPRIEKLTETLNEAGDHELLGVAYVALGEIDAARTAFATALAIERARNPQSELVGTLMKRMSEI